MNNIGTVNAIQTNNPEQQQLTATNNIATFPGVGGQMVLTAAGGGQPQQSQPTQYVVQNVVQAPVSFVQSK